MENEYKVEETDFGTRTSHPSYGTIMFNRSNSRVTPLFGSSIKHNNVITKDAMNESQQLIQDVTDLFSQKKALTKADKEAVISKLRKLSMDLGCNLDFIADQFNEQMDKTVMEAKGEIESFCQNKINAIASAALVEHRDEILKLENPVDIESE